MNKIKIFVATALLFVTAHISTQAQTAAPKIGYTNVDYVLSIMPESKQIESDLKTYSTQLETQLQTKVKEFETKGETYQKGAATMTDVIRKDKEKELMNLRSSIEEFQRNAEISLQKKQQALLEPAYKKMQKAIDDVAKSNGYTYVFNSDAGAGTAAILLHAPEDGNISDLVLKQMGITPPAKGAPAPSVQAPAASNATPGKTSVAPTTGKKNK
jgi:outer membrane protein